MTPSYCAFSKYSRMTCAYITGFMIVMFDK